MKIGIVIANNIEKCPYINPYIEILKRNDIEYDVIYANRIQYGGEYSSNTIKIRWDVKKKTLLNYLYFRKEE